MTKPAVIAILASLAAGCLFYGLYRLDNKYMWPGPRAEHGVLVLGDEDAGLTYLTDGWEFYGALLSPEDFAGSPPAPDAYVYIGEHYGFDLGSPRKSAHGSATLRLNIFTGSDERQSYALELPEIFSAYRLWVNGEPLMRNGEPDPDAYSPEISRGYVSFSAKDRVDIVLAMTNYSHYYSGLIYPPAFGAASRVAATVNFSVVAAALRVFFAAAVGLFYFCLGAFSRGNRASAAFGALCFLYAGSASHPLASFVSIKNPALWYGFEDFCFYAMLGGFCYIGAALFLPQGKIRRFSQAAGALCGMIVAASPALLSGGAAAGAAWLSIFVGICKLAAVCVLAYISFRSAGSGIRANSLLAATAVFGVSLAVDAFVALYEPARFGWPTELGAFVMVLVTGALLTADTVENLREQLLLKASGERLAMSYRLLTRKIEQARESGHDLRHHMAVLSALAQNSDVEGISGYLKDYANSLPSGEDLYFSQNHAVDAVLRYYHARARAAGADIRIELRLPEAVAEQDICVLFGNLLENAVEACGYIAPEKRFISFAAAERGGFFTVLCDNSFDGRLVRESGGNATLISRARGGRGVGTASVRAIAKKYGGSAEFNTEDGVFRAAVTLDSGILSARDAETS